MEEKRKIASSFQKYPAFVFSKCYQVLDNRVVEAPGIPQVPHHFLHISATSYVLWVIIEYGPSVIERTH